MPVDVAAAGAAVEVLVELEDLSLDERLHTCLLHAFNGRVAQRATCPEPRAGVQAKSFHYLAELLGGIFTFEAQNLIQVRKPLCCFAPGQDHALAAPPQGKQLRGRHIVRIVSVVSQQAQHSRQPPEHPVDCKSNLGGVHPRPSFLDSAKEEASRRIGFH